MIHLEVIVDNTADLLDPNAYDAGALLRWESCATVDGTYVEAGTVALVADVSVYDVWDPAGEAGTWYQTRISDSGGTTFSPYSYPFQTAEQGPYVSVNQLRGFITTPLPDLALASYLRSALDSIDDFLGPMTLTEHLTAAGDLLSLGVEADHIVSVVENENGTPVTLDATDYAFGRNGQTLRRLTTGTHPAHWRYSLPPGRIPYWLGRVAVTYVRRADSDQRIRVAVALVQLDLNHHPGMAAEQIGTWSETYANRAIKPYDEDRMDILRSLIRNDNDDFVF